MVEQQYSSIRWCWLNSSGSNWDLFFWGGGGDPLKTLINLWVPQEVKDFLTSWAIVKSRKKTVSQGECELLRQRSSPDRSVRHRCARSSNLSAWKFGDREYAAVWSNRNLLHTFLVRALDKCTECFLCVYFAVLSFRSFSVCFQFISPLPFSKPSAMS